jgi:hypothetical protein
LPRLGGQLVFDGGYSDNVPVVHANTVTVSPFSGNQDICPLDDCEIAELLNLNLATGPTTSIAVSRENLVRVRMALLPPTPDELLQVSVGCPQKRNFFFSRKHEKMVQKLYELPRNTVVKIELFLNLTFFRSLKRIICVTMLLLFKKNPNQIFVFL